MPDDDRIPTSLTAPWKKVLRHLRSRRAADETADAVAIALAATGVVGQSHVPGPADARRHLPTDVAERAAAGFAATIHEELALVSPGAAALMLAKRVIEGLAYHYGLDRIGPLLAAEGAYSTRELQDLFGDIVASDQISKLAKRLLARPTGDGLRAPDRRRRVRRSLEDFVNTPIADLR